MLRIIKTQVRTSLDVPFYDDTASSNDPEYRKYVYNNFIANNKLIKTERAISEDGLTMTILMTWDSEDSFLDLCTDEFCGKYLIRANQYNMLNGIASDIRIDKSE